MTIKEALKIYLLSKTEITDIISDRLYPEVLPQGTEYPALTYLEVSNPVFHDVDIAYPRFQLSSWAETYLEADTLKNAIKEVMQRYKGIMGGTGGVHVTQIVFFNSFDMYDPDTKIYHVPSDYKIIYREVT